MSDTNPRLISIGDLRAPEAPRDLAETGVDRAVLTDLTLKTASLVMQFTTQWAARRLHLPVALVAEILEQLRDEQMLDMLGSTGRFDARFAISRRGREVAERALEISGYVGPAPVSLEAYATLTKWQCDRLEAVRPEEVAAAISELVLTDEAARLAGLALFSGRSLFLSGPPGNGKTALARLLHGALRGSFWVPHALYVENSIIRVYDPQLHRPAETAVAQTAGADERWLQIQRPLIVSGGELTIDALDLIYSPSVRYYEAPLHIKSNGGILLIDDFGRQRVAAHDLLNRWIVPLEHQIDFLTLHTGQKISLPFRQMLIFATNLDPQSVTDPAFLRRMGYRLQLGAPSPERYADIFDRYAARIGAACDRAVVGRLLERYRREGRELRCCEPRDLIERARDYCRFTGRPIELNDEVLSVAWTGYFGQSPDRPPPG